MAEFWADGPSRRYCRSLWWGPGILLWQPPYYIGESWLVLFFGKRLQQPPTHLTQMVESAIFLILGWLLGLISFEVNDRRSQRKEKADLIAGILIEFEEAKIRLALLAYKIAGRYKNINKEFLEWIKPHLENYEGTYITENISKLLKDLSKLDDEILSAIYARISSEGRSMSIKVFSLPYLDSRISLISSINRNDQRRIIEIRAQIAILNEMIEEARFYHKKTFDSSMSPENHDIVRKNIDDTYGFIGMKAQHLVDIIHEATMVHAVKDQ